MRRRGGYGFHRQPYSRDEGSSSYSHGDTDDDAAAGSYRGRGGRRGRKDRDYDAAAGSNSERDGGRGRKWLPPGLKGKEIGFYFRDRARSRKIANRMEVSLDPARERQIRELLNSIDLSSLQDDKHEQKLVPASSGTRYFSLQDEYKPKKDFSRDVDIQYSSTQEKLPVKMESDSDFSTLTSPKVKMEMDCEIGEGSCGYISKQGNSEVKQEHIRDFGDSSFSENREWELMLDISDDFSESLEENSMIKKVKNESDLRPPSFSECDNRIPAEDRYKHIGDSVFKRKFLQNIKGNIDDNLERSLSRKNSLDCNKELDRNFKAALLAKQNSSHYKKMMEFRKTLPSFKMQDQILKLVEENQVTVISGETGCGKTTQVAQFILDDYVMKEKGSMCHVVCTQPRRISATSVAVRVADERDEICGRDSVGYQIRLEKKVPRKRGSILFCTTGVMLQWMKSDAALGAVSHLVLDEIHERDVTSDFIITILKDIIPKRPDLKIILMSATLNAEKFAKYFDGCPCINIPGFTHPVKEYYLEDVLQMTRFQIQPQRNEEIRGWKRHLKFAKAKIKKIEEFKDFIEPYVRHLASEGKYSNAVLDMLKDQSSEEINLDLMAALIQHICVAKDNGAILVFLPGWDKISALHKLLADSGNFPSSRYLIIPLHSLMPTVIQKSVFDRPPKGVRKIVIATNIAETSITIDDVVYVIDCGKIKLQNFDVDHNIQTLKPEWVSLANARQRRGRAGRVQPGECYHLYTKAREMTLANYPLPEMLRTRLDEVILQIKILQLGKVKPFLSRVMDPPDHRTVDLSITLLMNLNALDADENLTPLGFHLAKLPVDPQTGKMILMGALFSCVDPIFSIAASLGFKDAFHIPLGREDEVIRKKRELAKGSKSDHLVLAEALKQWEVAEEMGRGRQFCWDYFLSPNTLQLLRDMKRQFAEHLHEMDFLNSRNPKNRESNLNSQKMSLVKAIICAGLYPNVAIVRSVKKKKNTVIAKVSTPEDGTVHIHPRSINEKETMYESPFLLYHLKLKSTNINLHDTTMMYPLPLLFFGQGVDICNDDGFETIAVDKFVRFKCQERTANLVKELRTRLDQLLEFKITHPGTINWNRNSTEGDILRAIIELITSEDKHMMMEAQEEGGDDFSD